ncbi:uncharacterized protein LOC134535402 [Bacillus rossius redtenbacheri]|uniref:uncharacterized protein LOC134535402 n=1 Tax=Bacillus rossius redtenbacheri TaxID=93214 RepID=UPI002FDEF6EB
MAHCSVCSWFHVGTHLERACEDKQGQSRFVVRRSSVQSGFRTLGGTHLCLQRNAHASPLQVTGQATPPVEKPPQVTSSRRNTPPLASSYCSALVARQHAQDNLRHRPLPDVLDDATYRALEARRHARPGLSLDVTPQAAAVGWRGHGAAGPTQCSKLRVYRPKTAASSHGRPGTDVSVESRLPRRGNVSEMQLAICWDVKPPPEQGEPRPSPHIDGSNGSAAPAVFTLVHQAQPEEQPRCGKPGGCSPDHSLPSRGSAGSGPKSAWADEPTRHTTTDGNNNLTEAQESGGPDIRENVANATGRHGSGSSRGRTGSADGRKRAATARNSARNSADSAESNASLNKQKHHRSSPNLAGGGERHDHYVPGEVACADKKKLLHARPCIACELKASGGPTQERPRSDYKMAFKAGKPGSSSSSGSGRPQTSKVRVPKPRAFLKRNYSIDTLAPPFSLWPGNTGQDYPEHWRLASVYQHAYKPPEARKKPLLASVYQ